MDKTVFCGEKARKVYKTLFPSKTDVDKVMKVVVDAVGIDVTYKED